MKILFLCSDFVLPANRGLRVRTLSQLRLLSSIPGVESIKLLSLTTVAVPCEAQRELEQLLPKVTVAPPIVRDAYIRRSRKALLNFLRRRLMHNEPYLIATHRVASMAALIGSHLRSTNFDVVYFGYLGMMAYIDQVERYAPNAHRVLEQHNMEWQIFFRLTEHLPVPLRLIALLESYALRRYERRSMQRVDRVIAISDADAAQFRDLSHVDPVVVPPYVEAATRNLSEPSGFNVGYIGHLTWQPNVIGLNWFCREVWPLVRAKLPGAQLVIAGPGLRPGPDGSLHPPPEWQVPGVRTVGFLESLEELYRSTLVMVAPVFGGSGVRMKILETLSAGMPTITTKDGAAGLPLRNGHEVLIADDAPGFANHVAASLSDKDLRSRLRTCGYVYLEEHHSMKLTLERMALAMRSHC